MCSKVQGRAAPGVPAIDGPLRHLVEQLWQPPLQTQAARIRLGRETTVGWHATERYLVVPSLGRARLLVPDGPRRVTMRSLLNHRGLRKPTTNVTRVALGAAVRVGAPLPFPRIRVEVRDGTEPPALPLALLAEALGRPEVFGSLGVNTSPNRKPTIYLVDRQGTPVGFAKLSWDSRSSIAVATESQALDEAGGLGGPARTPALLARGDYYGWPYLVTAPIPLSSKGVRADVPPPTAQELFSLCPLDRRARLDSSGQLRALAARLDRLTPDHVTRAILEMAKGLLADVRKLDPRVPITRHWHGDLTPWNAARDGEGTLWCWDWESSERDAVAGLDSIHWHTAVRTERGHRLDGAVLRNAIAASTPMFVAAGLPRDAWGHVGAVYAITITERALALAVGPGGWEDDKVRPRQLQDLLAAARAHL